MKSRYLPFPPLLVFLLACGNDNGKFDASGTFEATEVIVSSEANGKIMSLTIQEGDELKAGQPVGNIDSTQLYLTKLQLLQNQRAILSGRPDVAIQLQATQKELDNALADKKRIENLTKGEVASQKQLDDANTRIAVLQSRLDAQKSSLNTSNTTLNEQAKTIEVQLRQIQDQLNKCKLVNPIDGTVLTKYSNAFEMTSIGKPLYKIADLTWVELRTYVTNDQFSNVKLGQKVKVSVDAEGGNYKTYEGTVDWINNKAEFTPKTIQTKNERANLVYAIKIKVKNDGFIKIGMYGEVVFN